MSRTDPTAGFRLARSRRTVSPEFEAPLEGLSAADRREVLKTMGASLVLSGLAGCTIDPHPEARPYVDAPDSRTPGSPKHYATAVTFGGYAQPVLAKTFEGRPIKVDGLPEHPAVRGASDAFTQAALLGLYDPDRSRSALKAGRPAAWSAFEAAMVENAARLDARRGEGFRLLTGATSSPTFARQMEALLRRWPLARWHVWEPVNDDLTLQATRSAFRRTLEPRLRLDRCEALVCLDADPLGPGARQTTYARDWSARRKAFQALGEPAFLAVAEPTPTLTGAMASDRLAVGPDRVVTLLLALASALGAADEAAGWLSAREIDWVASAARRLRASGPGGLVMVGPHHPPAVQARAFQINSELKALGRTVEFTEPILIQPPDGARSLDVLVDDLEAGRVDTLAVFDTNPVYSAPPDLGFTAAMKRAGLRVHVGLHFDETAALCQWHAATEHDLERWGDARATDGRPSLIQPLVRSFLNVRSRTVLLENLQGRLGADGRAIVAETWASDFGGADDPRWPEALAKGYVDRPAAPVDVGRPITEATPLRAAEPQDLTVVIRPDPTVWDGGLATNPWLQELPKPFSKVTWENVVGISPALARELHLADGDTVALTADGRTIEGPAWIVPGQHRRTVLAYLGYGRRLVRSIADGIGYDVATLRTRASPWQAHGATLRRAGGRRNLACTQPEAALEGRDFVRTVPRAAADLAGSSDAPPPSFYPDWPRPSPSWGMAVDTDLCIGCNACVTACDSENNVPMVGREQVARGREMHWLRIDQYYEGEADDPRFYNQPVPCMHCEKAPCEMACPVNAAVHSTDGLNVQVYNRCIGTRTCSSFCPYKVRRFNWFDFTGGDPPELRAARNPEVTVRDRGVMEKCTYCVQRIEKARIQAKVEGRDLRDGEVTTACQDACPTHAIVFGDISDPNSAVSRLKAQKRNYALLEEVNTRPRTTYLARLSDEGSADDEA